MFGRPLAACIAVALFAGRASAQRAEADAEFQRGRTLMAKGETAEACRAFEASMKLDPEKGTLYNLGLCHEKLGKLASAYSELDELSRTDTNKDRAEDAGKHAAALLPRLTRMDIRVKGHPEGLVVTRTNKAGEKVDVTPLIGKQAPVDPGTYVFEATADGREPLTKEVELSAEGDTVTVDLPLHKAGDKTAAESDDFPIDLPHRPILIPQRMLEVTGAGAIITSQALDRVAIDAGGSVRGRLGPLEVRLGTGFHVRSGVIMDKPSPWDTIGGEVRYPIDPAFVAGLAFVEHQPLRDYNRGSDLAGTVERKLLLGPLVAVDGYGGIMFSQRQGPGDALVVFGEGRAQFHVVAGLSVQASASLGLNLLGDLYDHVVDLGVGALALYAIKPNLDVFVAADAELLPDADRKVYTVGASWRSR